MRRALFLAATALATPAAGQSVSSPDGDLTVGLEASPEGPVWSLTVEGQEIIIPSRLGLALEPYENIGPGMVVAGVQRGSDTDSYTLPAGKTSSVSQPYNQLTVSFAESDGKQRRYEVVVRAYDEGAALRYVIPRQPGIETLRLAGEGTEFRFGGDYACHGLNLGSYGTGHEGEYDPVQASAIRPHNLYELPLLCRTGADGPAFAIAEAAVKDWPALYLAGPNSGDLGVSARLARRVDDPAVVVKHDLGPQGLSSPWRVVMVADRPGRLIESTLLTSLNPQAEGDFSWVQPGKTAWDWWNGPLLASVPKAGTNTATAKGFIDFAAEHDLRYMMIDDGWYVGSGGADYFGEDADPTTPVDAIDIPELVHYGAERDVGIILWVHWSLLDRDMERILTRIANWGVKGIKVDFMNRDDQQMIDFYHRLAAATARHRLLLDLHGSTHPWGMTRTWPQFLTQEGVLGAEYNKWTRRITARHNLTLPYTRMLLGPMDYTPGGFRNRTPETFAIRDKGPEVQTTRGQTLAMYVVYESPLQSVADSPDAYRGQPGLDFIEAVPASWDETRFLDGKIGESVAIARRKGKRWFVGAMTVDPRTMRLPLDFLGGGEWRATIWEDGATPVEVVTRGGRFDTGDTLALAMAGSGGAVAMFEPLGQ